MLHPVRSLLVAATVLAGRCATGGEPPAESPENRARAPVPEHAATIDFNRDVRPLLSEACFHCHGPDEAARKGELRLDTRAGLFKRGAGGRIVTPSKPAESELYRRITADDDAERMPPAKSGRALTGPQVELIGRWIRQGARWDEHWAYVKPVRPPLPQVTDRGWPRTPIDYFILARLESESLRPAAPADRYRLARRATLDLTGLPPSIEDVDAFVNDPAPDAYERMVDRLLSSARCGEHLARHWLDLARYADTNGYHVDLKRSIWPWRDWVIAAFNANMPFDQFTIEQIAGDLLPNAAPAQRIATGFHRNTMFNEEGGIDEEEFRTKAVVDRVGTTMTAWMGTTTACSECHDHKYDPFTQREFYGLYAFFNNVNETGGGTFKTPVPIERLDPPAELVAEMSRLRSEIDRLQGLANDEAFLRAELAEWERSRAEASPPIRWIGLDPGQFHSEEGATLVKLDDQSIRSEGTRPEQDRYTVIATTDATDITAVRLELLTDAHLPHGGPGRHETGNPVVSEFSVKAAPKTGAGEFEGIAIALATADFSQEGWSAALAVDSEPATGWAIYPQVGKPHEAVYQLGEPIRNGAGTTLSFTIEQRFGAGALVGRFRLSITSAAPPVRAEPKVPDPIADILTVAAEGRSDEQWGELLKFHKATRVDPAASLRSQLTALERRGDYTLVMNEMEQPRPTQIHVRGNFLEKGDQVEPGVPAVLHPLPAERQHRPNRLDLARWLVDSENPLTARVAVNRSWQMLFGTGLVKSSEDFGTQGDRPSHAELLDWLATEFSRNWDQKALLRLLVTSAAYRQSSQVSARLLEVDPYNRLVTRGPRVRLDAEAVRDAALKVAGLLDGRVGGPSVFPYQPPGMWEDKLLTTFGMQWTMSQGADQYRRAMYTFLRRSMPHPMFTTFDAPSREYCVASRPRTNTPLQALTTLNDPQFVEAAGVFAQRILQESGPGLDARITFGFRMCVARPPGPSERDAIAALYHRALGRFQRDSEAAARLSSLGTAPRPDSGDVAELAAWTVVANVLLNLDESLNKG